MLATHYFGGSRNNNPMLTTVMMHLKTKAMARINLDALNLVPSALFKYGE